MSVLESLAPAQKPFLDFLTEISGVRPNARDLYAVGPDGSQRVLVPTGKDRYDLHMSVNVGMLTGRETDGDLQALVAHVPKTTIERAAAWTIENITLNFVVGKFGCKFMHSKTRWAGAHTRIRYRFFRLDLGEDQIVARIRRLESGLLRARGLKIVEACAKRHIAPYGPLAAVLEAFSKASALLERYSRDVFERRRRSEKNTQSSCPSISAAAAVTAAAVLQILKDRLPRLYESFRVMVSIEYPETCGGTGPPAGGV